MIGDPDASSCMFFSQFSIRFVVPLQTPNSDCQIHSQPLDRDASVLCLTAALGGFAGDLRWCMYQHNGRRRFVAMLTTGATTPSSLDRAIGQQFFIRETGRVDWKIQSSSFGFLRPRIKWAAEHAVGSASAAELISRFDQTCPSRTNRAKFSASSGFGFGCSKSRIRLTQF